MKEGMLGVAYLAMKSKAPILPVGLSGTEKVSAWHITVPLCRMRINIGQPFTPPIQEGASRQDATQNALDLIMNRIAALLPEKYRGVYAATAARGARVADDVASQAGEAGHGTLAP
jgi:1-acyl-sn-glycerol-3-phosphate acyltransferase